MCRTLIAALAAAALLGWGFGTAGAQQAGASPADAGAQSGATGSTQPPSSGTAAPGTATADPAKVQTYIQMRKYLQSQVISMTPSDLSSNRDAIEKQLRAANRQWMSPDEFIEFHRQVQADPALKTMVEAQLGGSTSGTTSSGGAASPGASPQ